MRDLRAAIAGQVSEGDLKAMVQAQVDKAKAGDAKAAKFVFDLLGCNQPIKLIQNNHYHTGNGKASSSKSEKDADEPELRHRIFVLLERADPLTPGQIAARLKVSEDQVKRELTDAGIFARVSGGKYTVDMTV